MFWRFDLFFSPVPQLSDNDKKGTVPQSNVKEKKEETFKPEEEEVNSEKDEKMITLLHQMSQKRIMMKKIMTLTQFRKLKKMTSNSFKSFK